MKNKKKNPAAVALGKLRWPEDKEKEKTEHYEKIRAIKAQKRAVDNLIDTSNRLDI